MVKIIGLSGSLRRQSFNAALLRAAARLAPEGAVLEIHSIRDVPLYDGDLEERDGIPEAVTRIKNAIAGAEGLLLATPEYNNSIPGVFKNAIDWLTRPPHDVPRVFGGKPVAVMGASPAAFGTLLSQNAWLSVLRTIGTAPWFGGRMLVSHAGQVFDAEGELVDAGVEDRLKAFIAGFIGHLDRAARTTV
jgi:NAD(P)H-dependent FMN reductase